MTSSSHYISLQHHPPRSSQTGRSSQSGDESSANRSWTRRGQDGGRGCFGCQAGCWMKGEPGESIVCCEGRWARNEAACQCVYLHVESRRKGARAILTALSYSRNKSLHPLTRIIYEVRTPCNSPTLSRCLPLVVLGLFIIDGGNSKAEPIMRVTLTPGRCSPELDSDACPSSTRHESMTHRDRRGACCIPLSRWSLRHLLFENLFLIVPPPRRPEVHDEFGKFIEAQESTFACFEKVMRVIWTHHRS